jgi:hypothetical protein
MIDDNVYDLWICDMRKICDLHEEKKEKQLDSAKAKRYQDGGATEIYP